MSQEKSQDLAAADLDAMFDEVFAGALSERGNPVADAPDIVASLDETGRAELTATIKALGELFSNLPKNAIEPERGDDQA